MKQKLSDLFLQIIPVMIGVFLGFLVSGWADDRKSRHQAGILVESIASEIRSNKDLLKTVVDYHVMVRDSCRYYADQKNVLGRPQFFGGTRIIPLTGSAFSTGIQTGIINELSLDRIQALNQLYTLQDNFNEFGKILMAGLINKRFSDREEDIRDIARYLAPTMTDVVLQEQLLIREYERMLGILGQ